uniref:Bromo domain-containing protein n=1 Tax=Amorphochlora amoebiformis TaxID=1561963 RepID=A0A7S0DD85_9EUKA
MGMDEKEEISTPCTPRRSLRSRKSSLKNRTSTETETPDVREPETPDAKEPETPDVKEPEAPDVKESEIPDVKEPETPDVKEPAAIEEEKAKVTDEKEEVDGSKSTSEAVKQTLDRLSAWELTPLEEDKHLVFRPMTLDPAIKESALKIVDSLMDTKEFEPFRFPVDLEHFPHYTGLVNVPIDLSLIRARIENDYYRQIDALTFDIKHIQANCVRFNKPDSFVVKAVENMVKKYEEARDDLRGANVG